MCLIQMLTMIMCLTFNLDVSGCLGAAGGRSCLTSIRCWVVRSNDVQSQTTKTVLVVRRPMSHCSSVFKPLNQRTRCVAFHTTLKREPATSTAIYCPSVTALINHQETSIYCKRKLFPYSLLSSVRPVITFPAEERHRPSTSTKLYLSLIHIWRCRRRG